MAGAAVPHETAIEIDRDLHRAGRHDLKISDADAPGHRACLRTLLMRWCSNGGNYHQAMSHIGAVMLVHDSHDAERAFSRFESLMNCLPAGYYDEMCTGCRVEVRAMCLLFRAKWPQDVASMPALREPLEISSTQWLLSLWSGVLPHPIATAVWHRMQQQPTSSSSSSSSDEREPSDASIRIALALVEASLPELREAAELDAAEEEEGGGSECYMALQRMARGIDSQFGAGPTSALLQRAWSMMLSERDVREARATARAEIMDEDAREAQRKAQVRRERQVTSTHAVPSSASLPKSQKPESSSAAAVAAAHHHRPRIIGCLPIALAMIAATALGIALSMLMPRNADSKAPAAGAATVVLVLGTSLATALAALWCLRRPYRALPAALSWCEAPRLLLRRARWSVRPQRARLGHELEMATQTRDG